MAQETMQFKTELEQLLHLITHSLYSHREVFLRELISNACDAIDKIRFQGLTNPDCLEDNTDWKITLRADEEAGTLILTDNGIGMSREDVIENLGTIAHSGTKAFLARAQEADLKENPELIGQFGVGFYASFMVAESVTVDTKAHGTEAVRWSSNGTGNFTLDAIEKADRGTTITLHLKEDAKEYLNEWTIRSTVKKFSDFLEHPVTLITTQKDEESEVEEEKEEQINSQKAIWLRPKNEITADEYSEFYKHLSHDMNEPAETIHYNAEGAIEFKALLFIPEKRPFDLMMNHDPKAHLNLYVQRVFISNEFDNLLPGYLRFVKGVVDASDLPLNVSREILQENPQLEKIRNNLVSRILKTLAQIKEKDFEKFSGLHEEFGTLLKEGLQSDWSNKEKIADLLLFESTTKELGEKTTLAHYIENLTDDQEEILYLAGENRDQIANSPYLERYKAEGREVLLMTDPIDDFVMPQLMEFKGKKLKAVNKGEQDDTDALKEEEKTFEGFIGYAKELLNGVKEVKLTTRLKDSAAVLVGEENTMSPHIEEMMRRMGQPVPETQSVLELNPEHPIVQKVQALHAANDSKAEALTHLLHDQAVLASGAKLKDPAAFTTRLNDLLSEA
ncbi:MAG: molecular chaperone HtpG [Kiritimatiellaceae bacterium]|nr:MAG: molecular chaperone HtpG [Kiritimatiellaceae bacterium]